MRIEHRIHDIITRAAPDYVALLREFIAVPSILGSETALQTRVKDHMRDLGVFEREVFANPFAPYVPSGRSYDDRPCIVGRIRGNGEHHLILNAHADTAPVEDPTSWTHPPFAGEIADGKLFGRGALDDKAGLAMMLLIADCLRKADVRLPGDVLLQSVIEDGDTGNGTLACTEAGYYSDAAVVIDGTWPFRIIDAHLGQIWVHFEIAGVAVASCSCRRGLNPLGLAGELIRCLQNWVASRNQQCERWLNVTDPHFVNVGTLHSGCWPGAVPEKAMLAVQIGFAPPLTPDHVLAQCRAVAQEAIAREPRCRVGVRQGSLWTPPHANVNNQMVQSVMRTIRRLRPGEMEPINQAVMGHCDLRHFRRPDGTVADACLYGPGGGGNPHAPDEFYHLDHFIPVAQNLVSAMLDFYGISG